MSINSSKSDGKIRPADIIVPEIYIIALMIGTERLVIFVTGLGLNKIVIDFAAVLTGIFGVLVFEFLRVRRLNGRQKLLLAAAALIIYGLVTGFIFLADIKNVFAVSRGNITEIINKYYGAHILYPDAQGAAIRSLTTGLAVLLFPVFIGICWEMMTYFKCRIAIVISSVLITIILLLGMVPPVIPVLFILSGIIATVSASGGRKKIVHEAAVKGAVAVTAMFIAAGVTPLVTSIWEAGESTRYRLSRFWSDIESGNGLIDIGGAYNSLSSGGMSDGVLGQSRGFSYNGSTHLRVNIQIRPKASIYIKGFVGGRYGNNRWEAADDTMEETAERIGYAAYKNICELSGRYGIDSIKIDRVSASRRYVYRPYGINIEKYPSPGSRSFYFTYCRSDWDNITFYQEVLKGTEYDQLERQYREYVYNTYLDVPPGLDRLLGECRNAPVWTFRDAYRFVYSRLSGYEYDTEIGVTPQDEDFVEYFLYDQKAGYCTHFASSAVIMFRMLGYPARYVAGYIVPQNLFEADARGGGYRAVVHDDRAHAWAEVYINGTGWVPVEMTPGYLDREAGNGKFINGSDLKENASQQATQDPDMMEDPEDPDEEDESSGQSATKNDAVQDPDDKGKDASGFKRILYVMAVPVLTSLILFILFMLTYFVLRFMTWNKFKLPKGNQSLQYDFNGIIIEMFHWIYGVSTLAGLSSGNGTDSEEFINAFEDHFDDIRKGSYEEILDLAVRANFAAGRMTAGDADKVCRFCRHMLEHEEKNGGLIRRLRIYLLKRKWKI